jgi:hypothetical protein
MPVVVEAETALSPEPPASTIRRSSAARSAPHVLLLEQRRHVEHDVEADEIGEREPPSGGSRPFCIAASMSAIAPSPRSRQPIASTM